MFRRQIILFTISFILSYSIANTYFCDGYTEGTTCSTGSTYELIDNLNNFSSNYNDFTTGFFEINS